MASGNFHIGIMGNLFSGKTTLMNALASEPYRTEIQGLLGDAETYEPGRLHQLVGSCHPASAPRPNNQAFTRFFTQCNGCADESSTADPTYAAH